MTHAGPQGRPYASQQHASRRPPPQPSGGISTGRALGLAIARLADRYVRVLPLNGRILQYTIQLPRGTPFATASAQALAELPADLRLVWRQQRGACTQASYTSPTLARELTDVGDPKGAVLTEYRSGITIGAAYDAADVTSATLSALDAPTPATGALC